MHAPRIFVLVARRNTPLVRALSVVCVWCVVLLSAGDATALDVLPLHAERASPLDLAVCGQLAGVPGNEKKYARHADLLTLPTSRLRLRGEFMSGEQNVTVVFLEEIWARLPRAPEADALLAFCKDGYAAVFPAADITSYRPFVILEIDGRGPDRWAPPGGGFDPGPYVISVATSVAPEAAALLDPNHKKPWGVTEIEAVNLREKLASIFEGTWREVSTRAARGREIWIHSCLSCHTGPGGAVGGTKSGVAFEAVAARAAGMPDYFRRYVRDPQGMVAGAKMEKHAHYTDEHLDALIAFLAAEKPTK
jgi:cytochrome c2